MQRQKWILTKSISVFAAMHIYLNQCPLVKKWVPFVPFGACYADKRPHRYRIV
uniref:Uncharacterized protein n=1 Tax=Actinobacillus sp. TaxID=41114 RepID=A0A894TDY3_9PAST|nr:hypothetical protein [Actinobacillus sp.]